ncbi:UpxY family transcription antiterminator [Neolewinella aurantiaca]|uniref:UpxY family transcription antiterminator n=1 Tax=Neolewinella aurantiaca TaxID=2602767 RepID=A0A5C7FLM8_9BACT|nr:UpxY family transcription antiterminator [Neolewinella aurantiaca]TXF90939.1 UpxY family transcription antiterminator [Neolewinella aurantiaca]
MAIRISSLNHSLRPLKNAPADDMHVTERRWFAVRTAAKHEKLAVKEIRALGIECYIPLREKTYNYSSKKVIRELPLMSGYVFVKIRREEENVVRFANYVSRFVTIGDVRKRVTEEEMDLLRRISTDRKLDWDTVEEAFDFMEGTPVEIIKGPLAGVRGVYINKKNKKTFVIALGSLNTCLSTCEIDPRYLVVLNGAKPVSDKDSTLGQEGKSPLW